MTSLGKIVGGGLPVGAYGGTRDIMSSVAPLGPVYQAGTLSGNPLAVAAGMKMLELLRRPGTYEKLGSVVGAARRRPRRRWRAKRGIALTSNRVGSMFTGFFTDAPVTDYASAKKSRHRALRQVLPRHARRAASTWRRRSSRPPSSRWRTTAAPSTARSRPPAAPSPPL